MFHPAWKFTFVLALLAGVMHAQDQKARPVVRVGVAVMQNTSMRPIATRVQRDRLVDALNHSNPKHPRPGEPKIEAIALQGYSPETVSTEARDNNCDYVVYTNLIELRAPGDPKAPDQPGEISVGPDPLANEPGLPYKHEPVHYAVVEFRIMHQGMTVVARTVSGKESMEADATVTQLMDHVAQRVRGEVTKPSQPATP